MGEKLNGYDRMEDNALHCSLLSSEGFNHGFGTRHLPPHSLREWKIHLAKQVHGTRILIVDPASHDGGEEADGLIAEGSVAVGVRTADCVPILLADKRSGRVAALHAGWRGTLAGIAEEGVGALLSRGTRAADLVAAIGPAIGRCCYEVESGLAFQFSEAFGSEVREGRRLDLRLSNRIQLQRMGLPPNAVTEVGGCTRCEEDLFFSFRREKERAGRQLSYIQGRSVS